MLGMPYVALFSPSGVPLYRGAEANQNALFLHRLQDQIPLRSNAKEDDGSPTLREYVEMVKQLKAYEPIILDGKHYILFVITSEKTFCKPQNDALNEFRQRPNIRIIEIRLQP
jgi:hypothetical protein